MERTGRNSPGWHVASALAVLLALTGLWRTPAAHADQSTDAQNPGHLSYHDDDERQRRWQREFEEQYPGYAGIGAMAGAREHGVKTSCGVRAPVYLGTWLLPRRSYQSRNAAFVAWQGYVHYAELFEAGHHGAAQLLYNELGHMPKDHELDLNAYTGWSRRMVQARDGVATAATVGEGAVALRGSTTRAAAPARSTPKPQTPKPAPKPPARSAPDTTAPDTTATDPPPVPARSRIVLRKRKVIAPAQRRAPPPGKTPPGQGGQRGTTSPPASKKPAGQEHTPSPPASESPPGKGTAPAPPATPAPATVASSSSALARAMKAAGRQRPPNTAAHHIVAGNAPRAAKARAILERFGVGINDAVNGVYLPKSLKVANSAGSAVHSTLHTAKYYKAVYNRLKDARTRADVERILNEIRRKLLAGGL